MDRIRAASIRALFAHSRTTLIGACFMTAYMVAIAWPYTAPGRVLGWLAGMIALFATREILVRRFRRRDPPLAALAEWERRFFALQLVAGLMWGATGALFIHLEEPITIALVLIALAAGAAGAVPAQAYSPPTFVIFCGSMMGVLAIRFLSVGGWSFTVLGAAVVLYSIALIGHNRVLARTVRESLSIRFENEELVEALRLRSAEAERARQTAEAASLAKSQFLAAASHDLRQPLYALGLFSATLEGLSLDAAGRRVVASIGENIAIMEKLFAGLLDLSRLQAGVVTARREAVAIDELFDGLRQLFFPIAMQKGIDLRFRSDGEHVSSDPVLLEQLLANLLSNALRYTEAGAVLVAARRRGEAVRLEVWDTGVGIAEADRRRIFDEFVQLGNAERDRTKGLGLGLSIVQRGADLLATAVEVASRPGRGSRFAIVQPAATAPDIVVVPGVASIEARTGQRVLIVEDEASVRDGLRQLLARWGCAVTDAATGDAAIAAVATGGRFDHVICDQRLPGGHDGLATIAAIRTHHPAPPPAFALVTGDVDPVLLARAHAAGVPLFQKPLAVDRLRVLLGVAADRDA